MISALSGSPKPLLALSGTDIRAENAAADLVATCTSSQIHFVEVWHTFNYSHRETARFYDHLAESGVTVSAISCPGFVVGGDVSILSAIRDAIDLASSRGIRYVNSYFGHGTGSSSEILDAYVRRMSSVVEYAADRHVKVLLENEFDSFGVDPLRSDLTRSIDGVERLLDHFDPDAFGWNADPANLYCSGQRLDVSQLNRIVALASYMHVKDVRIPKARDEGDDWRTFFDGEEKFVTCDLGTGNIPWLKLLNVINSVGYEGYLVLEPHASLSHGPAADRQAAEWVRQRIEVA